MYKEFYNLREYPFNITSDPSFFFSSTRHMDAFSHLVYGIQHRKGIIVVTGEIGTGKTTLCRTLLNHLDKNTKTALILNPNFSELQLLQLIIKDLGIKVPDNTKFGMITALNEFLIKESSLGHNVALIIDEAQNLKPAQLESIRLLSNLETEKEKLLQLILVGQPELLDKLKLPSLRQLNQRIAVRYHIMPLQQEETRQYILHRLKIAGANGQLNFTPDALEAVYVHSGGTPRLINVICDRALLAGFAAQTNTIDQSVVRQSIEEAL